MCLISGLLRTPITLWKLFEDAGATLTFYPRSVVSVQFSILFLLIPSSVCTVLLSLSQSKDSFLLLLYTCEPLALLCIYFYAVTLTIVHVCLFRLFFSKLLSFYCHPIFHSVILIISTLPVNIPGLNCVHLD